MQGYGRFADNLWGGQAKFNTHQFTPPGVHPTLPARDTDLEPSPCPHLVPSNRIADRPDNPAGEVVIRSFDPYDLALRSPPTTRST